MKIPSVDSIKTEDRARQFAIDWQHKVSRWSLGWGDLMEWQIFFEALADKFDLIEEFEEEGIL